MSGQLALLEGSCPTCGRALGGLADRPGSHAGGPATERIAAHLAWPKAGTDRMTVLLALRERPRTADELRVDLNMDNAARRLTDLKNGGWARPTDERRRTSKGSMADVYTLTEAALEILRVGK